MSTNQALTFRFAEASDAPVNLTKSLQEQHHLNLLVISRDRSRWFARPLSGIF